MLQRFGLAVWCAGSRRLPQGPEALQRQKEESCANKEEKCLD